jgi:hypothetical protein
MKRPLHPILVKATACLVALALAPAALAAQKTATPSTKTTYPARYHIRFLDNHAAEQLAWDQCAGKDCRIEWRGGELELTADAATQERLARALTVADAPRTQSFQLTMLAADNRADASGAELPEATRKALQDIKGFLPFTGYRLLDTAWLRTTGSAEAQLAGDGTAYSAELHFTRTGVPGAQELLIENFIIRAASPKSPLPAVGTKGSAGSPATGATAATEQQQQALTQLAAIYAAALSTPATPSGPPLIRTTFGMHIGETVVVGTSKIGGDASALVVLLTAVP